MARVVFTAHLRKHLDAPPRTFAATTVRELLDRVFEGNPRLRGYVLDDQDHLRQHVTVFVDNRMIVDRDALTDPVREDSEVYVMQALSGG